MNCTFCNVDLSTIYDLHTRNNHIRLCELNPNRKTRSVNRCNVCGKECRGKNCRSHREYDDKFRKSTSDGRKKFLKDNPDKHPWKNNFKFKSKPCELLKSYLEYKNIRYVPEYNCYDICNRNFSIDIAFPDIKIGIEVNGNQHYNPDGTLSDYYKERHNLIESAGWKLLEIHYLDCYKPDKLDLLFLNYNQPDYTEYFNKIKDKKSSKSKCLLLKEKQLQLDIENFNKIKKHFPFKFGVTFKLLYNNYNLTRRQVERLCKIYDINFRTTKQDKK